MPIKDKVASYQFTRPIQIQAATTTDDGQGGQVTTWTTLYTPFADIQNMPHGRGLSRLFKYMQLYPEATTIIVIRYARQRNISAKMRILSIEDGANHIYQIVGPPVNLNRANVSIYLFCKEVQAQGVN